MCGWWCNPHKCGSVRGRRSLCPVGVYKYNPVHYQIILFVSELFSLYSPLFLFKLFVFLFSSFILYFQLRLSPVPQTLPVPIPCYYHGSSTDNGHANNAFRPLSLPAPSRTEADPPADTEIIAGSLQVSNWCSYWWILAVSIWTDLFPKYFQKI
jgi:hypothetical protein